MFKNALDVNNMKCAYQVKHEIATNVAKKLKTTNLQLFGKIV